ncbi:MAG TPA: DUF58 domain-containing protein [Marmoricola sp.]|jgi:uncharacterized protein (DUF58 family)|nr:DUF58 domain-containing protein [Marmoricola sp.]
MTAVVPSTTDSSGPAQADQPGPLGAWTASLRDGIRALTQRGRAFVAGGVTAAVCGIALGERDLVRIGVLILLLPLVTAAFVSRSSHRLSLVRTITSNLVEADQSVTVQLEVTNAGSTTGLLLVEEVVPWALGQRPRFVIDAMQPGWSRRFDYPVRAEVRGLYEIGPLRIRVADPFGMLALNRAFTRTTTLVVVPAAEPLPAIPMLGTWTGSGDNRPRPYSVGSAADVTVREYQLGDDLRRVHWRSTARTGELMVRREEQPWQSRCTLFIDNRAAAHRGSGPDSSLERAVTAAASIAVHLTRLGFQIRLVTADGDADHRRGDDLSWHQGDAMAHARPVLERLAGLPTVAAADLSTGWVDDTTTGGLLIGVFGALGEHDRAFLSRLHTRGGASYALALAVDTWASREHRAVPGTTSKMWLAQRGWKTAELERSGSLQAAWQELGR